MAEPHVESSLTTSPRPTSVRTIVLAGLAGSVVVAYLSRTVLGPAGSVIQGELKLTNTEMGIIHGIWAIGYVWFQLPGGWLGDYFGRRAILPVYGLVWSLCTIWTAMAPGFDELWWSRLIFGAAQAGLIPCLTRSCADWYSVERRGTASAAITAGMSLGAVAATGLAAFLVPSIGWRLTCHLFALTGIAWAILFWLTFRNMPEQHPWVNRAELDLIRGRVAAPEGVRPSSDAAWNPPPAPDREQVGGEGPVRPPGGGHFLRSLGVYGSLAFVMLNLQGFCRTFCYNFLTSWFPTYLERGIGLRLENASLLTAIPLIGVVVGSLLGGRIIDRMLVATGNKRLSRSGVGAAALILAGLCFLAAVFTRSAAPALAVLGLGTLSMGMAAPATWAATMDLGRGKATATVMAIANMVGNLAAFACPWAVGRILDLSPGNWTLVLIMLASVAATGGVCWLFLDPESRHRDA